MMIHANIQTLYCRNYARDNRLQHRCKQKKRVFDCATPETSN
jgi:hypothetical protein